MHLHLELGLCLLHADNGECFSCIGKFCAHAWKERFQQVTFTHQEREFDPLFRFAKKNLTKVKNVIPSIKFAIREKPLTKLVVCSSVSPKQEVIFNMLRMHGRNEPVGRDYLQYYFSLISTYNSKEYSQEVPGLMHKTV